MAELQMAATESTQPLTAEQQAWLTEVYRSNFLRVFRLCRRLLRNPDDAEDATHEVFLRAVGAYQPRAAGRDVGSWLLTVARNHCLDILRRRQRLGRLMVRLGPDSDEAINPETSVVDREAVVAILDQLRDRERQALWASAVERRSLAAIAQDLRMSYMATAQLLHRARRHAAMLAARLAAIFGLVQLGRLARRAGRLASHATGSQGLSLSARQLVASAALPVALAVVVVSTAPTPPAPASRGGTASSRATTAGPGALTTVGPRALDLVDQPAGAVSGVVQQAVPVLGSTLTSTLGTVQGSVNQVTKRLTTTTTDVVNGVLGKRF